MIDLQFRELNHLSYAFVRIRLPKKTIYFIYGTKAILSNTKIYPETKCIYLGSDAQSFDQLLENPIQFCTQEGIHQGIYIGMTGKKALMQLHENNKKMD